MRRALACGRGRRNQPPESAYYDQGTELVRHVEVPQQSCVVEGILRQRALDSHALRPSCGIWRR
jgi:hypothetical protein